MICRLQITPSACKVGSEALAAEHPTLPIHKTSFLSCLPPQMATKHPALCARSGIYRIAPSDLSQPVPVAVEAVLVAEALAAEVLLFAVCFQDPPHAAAKQPMHQDRMPAGVGMRSKHPHYALSLTCAAA